MEKYTNCHPTKKELEHETLGLFYIWILIQINLLICNLICKIYIIISKLCFSEIAMKILFINDKKIDELSISFYNLTQKSEEIFLEINKILEYIDNDILQKPIDKNSLQIKVNNDYPKTIIDYLEFINRHNIIN